MGQGLLMLKGERRVLTRGAQEPAPESTGYDQGAQEPAPEGKGSDHGGSGASS